MTLFRSLVRALAVLSAATLAAPACSGAGADRNANVRAERVASTQQADTASTVTITLPMGVSPADVVLGATSSVSIDVGAKLANGDGTFGAIASDGSTHLWGGAQSGNIVSIGQIQLDSFSAVNGSIQTTTPPLELPFATVTGTTNSSAALNPPQSFSFPISVPSTNNGDLVVVPGLPVSLTTSAYANVSVLPLATLTLSAGTYVFQNLDLQPTATLNVDTTSGPVFITIQDSISNFLGLLNNSNPGELLVTVLGTDTTWLLAPFSGTVIAPNSEIQVGPFPHRGTFFGKSIEVAAGATVAHVPLAFALPAAGDLATTTTFTFGSAPGDLIVDASGQQTLFPMPTSVRTFNSNADLINFVAQTLNAVVVTDANGNPIGAEGDAVMYNTPTAVDASGNATTIVDPILAYLGGASGTVIVGGQTICLDQTKCGGAAPPSDPTDCSPDGTFCTNDSSGKFDFLFIYHNVGSSTDQTKGGFNSHQYVCLQCACNDCFFSWVCTPWLCTRNSGSNDLKLSSTFFVQEVGGNASVIATDARNVEKKNVNSISDNLWSLFVSVTINSNGNVGAGQGSFTAQVTGVCCAHNSSSGLEHDGALTHAGTVGTCG